MTDRKSSREAKMELISAGMKFCSRKSAVVKEDCVSSFYNYQRYFDCAKKSNSKENGISRIRRLDSLDETEVVDIVHRETEEKGRRKSLPRTPPRTKSSFRKDRKLSSPALCSATTQELFIKRNAFATSRANSLPFCTYRLPENGVLYQNEPKNRREDIDPFLHDTEATSHINGPNSRREDIDQSLYGTGTSHKNEPYSSREDIDEPLYEINSSKFQYDEEVLSSEDDNIHSAPPIYEKKQRRFTFDQWNGLPDMTSSLVSSCVRLRSSSNESEGNNSLSGKNEVDNKSCKHTKNEKRERKTSLPLKQRKVSFVGTTKEDNFSRTIFRKFSLGNAIRTSMETKIFQTFIEENNYERGSSKERENRLRKDGMSNTVHDDPMFHDFEKLRYMRRNAIYEVSEDERVGLKVYLNFHLSKKNLDGMIL